MEGSLYKDVTPSPHNLDIPHALVDGYTHTYTHMKNVTLEVKEVFGIHTSDMIKDELQKSFPMWVLQESSL